MLKSRKTNRTCNIETARGVNCSFKSSIHSSLQCVVPPTKTGMGAMELAKKRARMRRANPNMWRMIKTRNSWEPTADVNGGWDTGGKCGHARDAAAVLRLVARADEKSRLSNT